MNSGYNLPPGIYESDLPGWNDIDIQTEVDCCECGESWETEACVDGRMNYSTEIDVKCPACQLEFSIIWCKSNWSCD